MRPDQVEADPIVFVFVFVFVFAFVSVFVIVFVLHYEVRPDRVWAPLRQNLLANLSG